MRHHLGQQSGAQPGDGSGARLKAQSPCSCCHPHLQSTETPRSHRSPARAGRCGCAGTDGRASRMGAHPRDSRWPWRCAARGELRAKRVVVYPSRPPDAPPAHAPSPGWFPARPTGRGHPVSEPQLFGRSLVTLNTLPYFSPRRAPWSCASECPLDRGESRGSERRRDSQRVAGAGSNQTLNPTALLKKFLPGCSDFTPGNPRSPYPSSRHPHLALLSAPA